MARTRPDGSVQTTNLPTWQNVIPRNDHSMYRCMVEKVLFVDDPNNITQNASNPEVLYNVIIMGGQYAGQKISQCRLSSDLGGNNNFYERVLKASTKTFGRDALSQHDGDVVFVQFTQGHSGYPVITSCDGGVKTAAVHGAKKADGPRLRRKYNGIFEEINKSGEYTLIRHGGNFTDGEFIPNDAVSYQKKLLKNEVVEESFFSGLQNKWEGKNDIHTRTYAGGMVVKEDGKNDKMTVTTAGGAILEIDGKGGKITLTKGSTIIELDGETGKISLKGDLVDLGSAVSDFVVLFTELLVTFNTHIHDAPQAPAGVIPTTPPKAPMLASVGSTTVKVQP